MKHISRLAAAIAVAVAAHAPAQAASDDWQKLIGPAELAGMVGQTGLTVLDIRSPEAYAAGHVVGALNAPYGSWRGPSENPGAPLSDEALTDRMRSLGLTPDSAVIVTYQGESTTDFGAAARVYWTLKSAGLTRLAILNGGIAAWTGAGLGLSTEPAEATPSDASFALSDEWLATADEVAAVSEGRASGLTIDARPSAFYEGQQSHPAARRPGTIAGAANIVHDSWFDEGETRVSDAAAGGAPVLDRLRTAGYDAGAGTGVVSFCNTGHWAATNWFMLSEVAGVEGVKLYPESMVGWTLEDRPVVNGGS